MASRFHDPVAATERMQTGSATNAPAPAPAAWRTGLFTTPRRIRHGARRVASLKHTIWGPSPTTVRPGSVDEAEQPVGQRRDGDEAEVGDLADQAGDEQQQREQRAADRP